MIRESVEEKSRMREAPREDRPGDRSCERFGERHLKTVSERPLIGHGRPRYQRKSGGRDFGRNEGGTAFYGFL